MKPFQLHYLRIQVFDQPFLKGSFVQKSGFINAELN